MGIMRTYTKIILFLLPILCTSLSSSATEYRTLEKGNATPLMIELGSGQFFQVGNVIIKTKRTWPLVFTTLLFGTTTFIAIAIIALMALYKMGH